MLATSDNFLPPSNDDVPGTRPLTALLSLHVRSIGASATITNDLASASPETKYTSLSLEIHFVKDSDTATHFLNNRAPRSPDSSLVSVSTVPGKRITAGLSTLHHRADQPPQFANRSFTTTPRSQQPLLESSRSCRSNAKLYSTSSTSAHTGKMSKVVRSVKNVTKGYSAVEVKVRNGESLR